MSNVEPRVWIGCLAAYNAAKLHGEWVSLEGLTKSDIKLAIERILKESPEPGAEEWAIMDYDGFGEAGHILGENPDLDELIEVAEGIEDHGEVFAQWYAHVGGGSLQDFEDAYRGEYDDMESFAEELMDDCGDLANVPDHIARYFDYSAFARDLELGGDIFTIQEGGKVHVFWNN